MYDDMQKFFKELNIKDVRSIKNNAFIVALNQLETCKNLAKDESIPKALQPFELGRLKSLDAENKTIRVNYPDCPVNLMADGCFSKQLSEILVCSGQKSDVSAMQRMVPSRG